MAITGFFRSRGRPARWGVWAAWLVLFAPLAGGDTVILRKKGPDGKPVRLEGTVRVKGGKIHVTTADNRTVTVSEAEVERILRDADVKRTDFQITDALRRRVDGHQRLRALGATLRKGGPGAVKAAKDLRDAGADGFPLLVAALEDDKDPVVKLALSALGSIGVRSAADAIAARLPRLTPDLQRAALGELGRLRCVPAAAAIGELLENEGTQAEVKRSALAALARLRSDLVIPALIRALTRAETSALAAEALVHLRSPSALPYLERVVARKRSGARSAIRVIARTAGPEHAPLLERLKQTGGAAIRSEVSPALRRLREAKSTRVAAHLALLRAAPKEDVPGLLSQLEKLTGHDARRPREWATWWRAQNKARARVAVLAVGRVEPAALRLVKRVIEREIDIQVSGPVKLPLSRWSRIPGSGRHRGDALLDALEQWRGENPPVIAAVALTPVQIEMPGVGPVIGAVRPGRCGVISLPGLEAGASRKVRAARLAREGLHVLARVLRVTRAKAEGCPASPLYEAAELDRFQDGFSRETKGHIQKSLLVSVAELAGDAETAFRELTRLKALADPGPLSAELALLAERRLDLDQARLAWLEAAKSTRDPQRKALIDARVDLIELLGAPKGKKE